MTEVTTKLIGPGWVLVAAGAVLAGSAYFRVTPAWPVAIPFAMVLVEAALVLPFVLRNAAAGSKALEIQVQRLARRSKLDRLVDLQDAPSETHEGGDVNE